MLTKAIFAEEAGNSSTCFLIYPRAVHGPIEFVRGRMIYRSDVSSCRLTHLAFTSEDSS